MLAWNRHHWVFSRRLLGSGNTFFFYSVCLVGLLSSVIFQLHMQAEGKQVTLGWSSILNWGNLAFHLSLMAEASLLRLFWMLQSAFRSSWELDIFISFVPCVGLTWSFCNAGWGFQWGTMVGHHQSSCPGPLSVDPLARWDLTRVRLLHLLLSALHIHVLVPLKVLL